MDRQRNTQIRTAPLHRESSGGHDFQVDIPFIPQYVLEALPDDSPLKNAYKAFLFVLPPKDEMDAALLPSGDGTYDLYLTMLSEVPGLVELSMQYRAAVEEHFQNEGYRAQQRWGIDVPLAPRPVERGRLMRDVGGVLIPVFDPDIGGWLTDENAVLAGDPQLHTLGPEYQEFDPLISNTEHRFVFIEPEAAELYSRQLMQHLGSIRIGMPNGFPAAVEKLNAYPRLAMMPGIGKLEEVWDLESPDKLALMSAVNEMGTRPLHGLS